jgi:hypothetical protein
VAQARLRFRTRAANGNLELPLGWKRARSNGAPLIIPLSSSFRCFGRPADCLGGVPPPLPLRGSPPATRFARPRFARARFAAAFRVFT